MSSHARCVPVMDLNKEPSLLYPGRWHVPEEDHKRMGIHLWNPDLFMLHRTRLMRSGFSGIYGDDILRELQKKPRMPLLNANALDFLLQCPHLIPVECKKYSVYFWGTVYHELHFDRFVRYLSWDAKKREWDHGDTLVDGYGWGKTAAVAIYNGYDCSGQAH
jgi:hypothetical protein